MRNRSIPADDFKTKPRLEIDFQPWLFLSYPFPKRIGSGHYLPAGAANPDAGRHCCLDLVSDAVALIALPAADPSVTGIQSSFQPARTSVRYRGDDCPLITGTCLLMANARRFFIEPVYYAPSEVWSHHSAAPAGDFSRRSSRGRGQIAPPGDRSVLPHRRPVP